MQHRSAHRPIRDLPALWGAFLEGHLKTDITGLNRTLVFKPTGQPFSFQSARSYPLKGVPKTFEPILLEGHWPDNGGYKDPDGKDRYNLVERVAQHLPGSQDWLFFELQRPALELPHDERDIQDAIARVLGRFGLARIHPAATQLILDGVLNSHADGEKLVGAFFYPAWARLAGSCEPLHVTLLTLLWQEATAQRAQRSGLSNLKAYCRYGWTLLFRRPELRFDPALARRGIEAIRNTLHYIETAPIIGPPRPITERHHLCRLLCPIWKPTPERLEAEAELMDFYHSEIERILLEGNFGPLRPKSKSEPLPTSVQNAVFVVVQGILEAHDSWEKWDLNYLSRPRRKPIEPKAKRQAKASTI